jgi:hypothetical protein
VSEDIDTELLGPAQHGAIARRREELTAHAAAELHRAGAVLPYHALRFCDPRLRLLQGQHHHPAQPRGVRRHPARDAIVREPGGSNPGGGVEPVKEHDGRDRDHRNVEPAAIEALDLGPGVEELGMERCRVPVVAHEYFAAVLLDDAHAVVARPPADRLDALERQHVVVHVPARHPRCHGKAAASTVNSAT